MASLCALGLAALAIANALLHRDVLYPAVLQALVWCGVVGLYPFYAEELIPVPDAVFLLILGGSVLFSLGAFVATAGHRPARARAMLRPGRAPSPRALAAGVAIAGAGLALAGAKAAVLAFTGPYGNPQLNLRHALTVDLETSGGYGPLGYMLPFSFALAVACCVWRFGSAAEARPSRRLTLASLGVALGFGVLSSGRGVLIYLLLMLASVLLILRVLPPWKVALAGALGMLGIFVAGGLLMDKGGSLDGGMAENFTGMLRSAALYTLGAIPALSAFWSEGHALDLGLNTFRSGLAVLRALGFDAQVVPLIQPYVGIPDPINVYTVYHPYLKDFGPVGAAFMQFGFGLAHGLLYRLATVEKPEALHVYGFAVFMVPIAFQHCLDLYFSLASSWLQYALYGLLLTVWIARSADPLRTLREVPNG